MPTRVWEFALGGVLAIVIDERGRRLDCCRTWVAGRWSRDDRRGGVRLRQGHGVSRLRGPGARCRRRCPDLRRPSRARRAASAACWRRRGCAGSDGCPTRGICGTGPWSDSARSSIPGSASWGRLGWSIAALGLAWLTYRFIEGLSARRAGVANSVAPPDVGCTRRQRRRGSPRVCGNADQ